MEFKATCAIIQELEDSTLPYYIKITPAVIQYQHRNNGEIMVNISNLTTNSVTISPKAIIGEVQPVTIDESVFEKIE